MDREILSRIVWKDTFILALMRIAAGSLVIVVVMALSNGGLASSQDGFTMGDIVAVPFAVGICLAIALAASYLGQLGVPWVGLGGLLALAVIVGDPIIWLLKQTNPELVPVEQFGIVNPAFVFVQR